MASKTAPKQPTRRKRASGRRRPAIRKNGAVNEWYPNGVRLIANTVQGLKTDFFKILRKRPTVATGHFSAGKRVGLWVLWNQDGTKDREIFFRSDEVMVATRFVWYDHGQLHYMKRKYRQTSETKQLKRKLFFGSPTAPKTSLLRKNGALEGVQKLLHQRQAEKKETYKKGISQEQYVLFYADGSKALEKSNPRKRGADAEAIYWNEQGDKVASVTATPKMRFNTNITQTPMRLSGCCTSWPRSKNHRRRFRPKPPENASCDFRPEALREPAASGRSFKKQENPNPKKAAR